MSAIRLKVMLLAVTTALLGGCGNEYDGTYQAARGFIGPLVVMQVAGSDATLSLIDVTTNRVRYAEVLTAETKNEKLLLTNTAGKTYAFVRAVDEKGLECLNCGLGTGLPKSWHPYIPQ